IVSGDLFTRGDEDLQQAIVVANPRREKQDTGKYGLQKPARAKRYDTVNRRLYQPKNSSKGRTGICTVRAKFPPEGSPESAPFSVDVLQQRDFIRQNSSARAERSDRAFSRARSADKHVGFSVFYDRRRVEQKSVLPEQHPTEKHPEQRIQRILVTNAGKM